MSFDTLFLYFRIKILQVKKLALLIAAISIVSCKKSENINNSKIDSVKIIDSINTARTKINDSILSHPRFKDWEGSHTFKHDGINGNGKITFKTIGRDEYEMNGEVRNGKNYITISGIGTMRSDKHLSFEGEMKQSLQDVDNGKLDIRKGVKTFLTKDGGETFRLQQKVNSAGFVDFIDIKY